ncbi:unnamed protein product [Trypanosoma congolense IL3000]|uniref:WGS project CAEQ00000000 data, annotated contig 415 n=1 Tax=Trypanosoma congolense (strain IL3000) TaxID=1068625 RepID=F9WFQ2_TRYCI|nr:unnamed protein product [Trypanosoma congolense IL3000]
MTHGHDPPSHSPPSICGRGRRAGRFVRLHEAIAASRVAHGSGVGARAWLPPVVAEENVRPTELPRVRAEVHRGGQPKRDLLQLPSFTNIVFDTSSLLCTSIGVLNNLMKWYVVSVPFCVVCELDKICSHNNRCVADRRSLWRALKLRNFMLMNVDKEHFRMQRLREVYKLDHSLGTEQNHIGCLGFALYLTERDDKSVLLVTEDEQLCSKGKKMNIATCNFSELRQILEAILHSCEYTSRGELRLCVQ